MKAALENCRAHHRALAGMECEYSDTTIRWMTCSVIAKSGTSLERLIRSRRAMTLFPRTGYQSWIWIEREREGQGGKTGRQIGSMKRRKGEGGQKGTYPIKLSPIQHTPSIHPTVVSPLRFFHPNTNSALKGGRPAISAAKRIITVPHT
jgi:hypothetical protein